MENCLICLEPNNYTSIVAECGNCKIYYHNRCYDGIRKMKLNCPICRKPKIEPYDEYYFGYFDNVGILFRFLEITVFRLFMNYPNIITLLLLQIVTIPIVFIIISPYTLFLCILYTFRKIYKISYVTINYMFYNRPISPIYLLEDIELYFR